MSRTLSERLAFEVMQRETSAEVEEIVFAGLSSYCDQFSAGDHDERVLMMARAAFHARDTATRLRKEAADLTAALDAVSIMEAPAQPPGAEP